MKKHFRYCSISAFIILSILLVPLAHPRDLADATGVRVHLTDTPRRIITLAPSLGELAADLLNDQIERIIGVSDFTDYPPILKRVESIGPYFKFNLEKVASLRPDLILATTDGNAKDQISHLRELGLPIVVVATESLQGIEASIELCAQALNAQDRGKKILEQLRKGIQNIRDRARGRIKRKIILQVGEDPLVVVGKKSFLNEAIEIIGSSNAYNDASAHYPRPSPEDILQRNPEVIVILPMSENPMLIRKMIGRWTRFPGLMAVKNHQIKKLPGDLLLRPTLRLLEGLALLERAVYDEK